MVCLKDTRFILVRQNVPMSSSSLLLALLALKVCSRGYKRARGTRPKSLVERVNGCRELSYCSVVCLCCVLVGLRFDGFVMVRSGLASIDRSIPFVGRPAFPFIGQGKARVTAEGKRRTRESRRPSRSQGPSSPSYGSRRPYRCQQGQLRVAVLSVTSAMRRRHMSVMALHFVLTNVVVN